jgi:hypothetical protein
MRFRGKPGGGKRSLVMRGEGRVEGYYWEDEGLMLYVGESVRVVLYAYLGEGRSCFGVFVVMTWAAHHQNFLPTHPYSPLPANSGATGAKLTASHALGCFSSNWKRLVLQAILRISIVCPTRRIVPSWV